MVKRIMKAMANSIGVSKVMEPRHMVDIQLNTFTPVCTTELGALGLMKDEFDKRNVKVIGLSVDGVDDHNKWLEDIKDVSGSKPNYPIIADEDLKVAKLFNMLEGDAGTTSMGRTAVDNETVRTIFVIRPDK